MKNEINELLNIEEIEKEQLEIYPEGVDSEKCDKEINKLYKIKDWSEMFYYGKTKLIKERFLNIISKSEYSKFFEGLDFEYGINNKTKDVKKAFEIYKQQADNGTDILSMYKMYNIYRKDFKDFGFAKRNKILEKYYLFKCYSYLPKYLLERYSFLLNRFNIPLEIAMNFYYEDNNLSKFDKLIKHLYKYIDYYKIKKEDLLLIESSMLFEFKNTIIDKVKSFELLKDLIKTNNLEAIYKLGLFILKGGDNPTKFFDMLEQINYYRSFCDYAIYLYQEKKDYKKALNLLKKAIDNGIFRANYLYYDIFLNSLDFTKIEINEEFKNNIITLFNLLINDIVTDGVYSFFEYFYLTKLCVKHWNLKQFIDNNFISFTKEFIIILLNNTCSKNTEEEIQNKKNFLLALYPREEFFSEFHLSCGILYYYGIENIIDIDLEKSLLKFQISFDNSDSQSYQRFCYSYINKINQKLYNNKDKNIKIEDIEKSKKILFDLYKNSVKKEYISLLSSSFYYYLSKLYEKKMGNPGNEIMEYICVKKASDILLRNPGNGSIISYYRKSKAIIKLEKKREIYKININKIRPKNDSEGYGDDNSICPICMENKRKIFLYPCKHLFCDFCTKKIIGKAECPICREIILFSFNTENNNE